MRHDPHRVPGPQTYLGRLNKIPIRMRRYPTGKGRLDLRVVKNPHISTKHPTHVGVGAIQYAQRVLGRCSKHHREAALPDGKSRLDAVKNPHSSNKIPTHLGVGATRFASHRGGGFTLSDSGLGRSSTPIKAAVVKYAEVAKPPIYQQKPAIHQAEWYSAKNTTTDLSNTIPL